MKRLLTQLSGRFPIRLLTFGAVAVSSFVYGFLWHTPSQAGALVQRYGYYLILATFGWWLWSLWRAHAQEIKVLMATAPEVARRHIWAVLLILGLTLIAFLSVPYNYKVLYDELVLQSTASNMHLSREVAAVQRGYEVAGEFRALQVYLDKRPLFFPFIVSLVHDLTGFRVANAFILNTLLLPTVLGLAYVATHRLGGQVAGLAALVCFGASPLLAQNANGTGMEMLNLCMVLATLLAAIRYLEMPEERRLTPLVLACVLLAQTRYESAIYVGPVALIILEGWRRAGSVLLPPAAIVAPLLLLPYALQNTYVSGTPALWELGENVTNRFGVEFLAGNLVAAARYFFSVTAEYLSTPFLSMAGAVAIAWTVCVAVRNWRRWREAPPAPLAALLVCTGALANVGLLMVYYWGQFTDPLVFRLSLPMNLALALAIAWVVGRMPAMRASNVAHGLIAAALILYLSVGTRASARFGTLNQIGGEITWGEEWVAKQPPRSRLMISNTTSLNWLLNKVPSLGFEYARGRAAQIGGKLADGSLQEVLVFQYYRPTGPNGGFVLDPRDSLPAMFELEPITERLFGTRQMRISRVVRIDVEAATKGDYTIFVGGLHVATVGRGPAGDTKSVSASSPSEVPAGAGSTQATAR